MTTIVDRATLNVDQDRAVLMGRVMEYVSLDLKTVTMMDHVRQTRMTMTTTADHVDPSALLIDHAHLDCVYVTLVLKTVLEMKHVRQTRMMTETTADHVTINADQDRAVMLDHAMEDVDLDLETVTMMDHAKQTLILMTTTAGHVEPSVLLIDHAHLDCVSVTLELQIVLEMKRVKQTRMMTETTADHVALNVDQDRAVMLDRVMEDVDLDLKTVTMMDHVRQIF